MNVGWYNVIVGFNSISCYNDCLVIGDNCKSTHDEEVVVGDFLFGVRIPKEVKKLIVNNPEAYKWLIRTTTKKGYASILPQESTSQN